MINVIAKFITITLPIRLEAEDEGGFSIFVVNLPGCVSCGETREEAIEMIKDAFSLMAESYYDHGENIPWDATSTLGCEWITFDLKRESSTY